LTSLSKCSAKKRKKQKEKKMHILISAMHMVGTFILAVAIALAFVGALLSPIFLGQFIAGRATPRIQHVIIAVLALVFVYGAGLAYVDFTSHTIAYWPMLPVFLPLYMGMGLYMGNSQKARKAEQERSLASWQNQLTADRKADAAPIG
jgi:apolipoprotein N-acyltransferase